jgi:hypothetical protein
VRGAATVVRPRGCALAAINVSTRRRVSLPRLKSVFVPQLLATAEAILRSSPAQ